MRRIQEAARFAVKFSRRFGNGPVSSSVLFCKCVGIFMTSRLGMGYVWRIPIEIHGTRHIVFVDNRMDAAALEEIFLNDEYVLPQGFMATSPAVIFDAGANVGIASVFFALTYPGATVHAFEPNPRSFEKLKRNVDGLNVVCHQVALSNTSGSATLHVGRSHLGASLKARPNANACITVPTLSFVDACNMTGTQTVDLLKFDIEGAEDDVITSETMEQVRYAVGEVHDDLMQISRADFLARFAGRIHSVRDIGKHRGIVTIQPVSNTL